MSRVRAAGAGAGMLAILTAIACYTLEEPKDGIESISGIIAPYPSVVVGDQSRDTTGAVASFRLIAFDQAGDTIQGLEATFVPLQKGLTFDASGVATGDSVVQGGVEVVGTAGPLQSLPLRIPVTVAPLRSRMEFDAPIEFEVTTSAGDTTLEVNRKELKLVLSGDARVPGVPGDTFTVGFIVEFRILEAPDALAGREAAVLLDPERHRSESDTTDQSGTASRWIQLRPIYFSDGTVTGGTRPDTVRVEATVRYPGVPAAASPVIFVVPVVCKAGTGTC